MDIVSLDIQAAGGNLPLKRGLRPAQIVGDPLIRPRLRESIGQATRQEGDLVLTEGRLPRSLNRKHDLNSDAMVTDLETLQNAGDLVGADDQGMAVGARWPFRQHIRI